MRFGWLPRRKSRFITILAIIVWTIFIILMVVNAPPASAQGSVGGNSINENKPFRLYGLQGSFDFSQANTNVSLATSASGSPTRELDSVRYVVVLKRKPLGENKRWRVYYRFDDTQPFPQYRQDTASVTRSNSWSLPLESQTFYYKMSVKLIITTRSGTRKTKQFKPGMLPVDKFEQITS